MSRPRFTILICVADREAHLRACLASLAPLAGEASVQLLIACDGGPAAMKVRLADALAIPGWEVEWLHFPERRGPARTRNAALPRATGELILFLNDDVRCEPGLLAAHDRLHRARPGHAVMGNTRWAPEVVTTEFMHWVAHHDSFYYLIPDEMSATWEYFHTMNLSLDRRWIDGGARFDEAFPDPAFEDTELGYRLCREGLQIALAYDAVLWHVHSFTAAEYVAKSEMRGRSARRFCDLYPELTERIVSEYDAWSSRRHGLKGLARRALGRLTPMEDWEARIGEAFVRGFFGIGNREL